MPEIEFVYFDIGGVLMLDFSGTDKWQQLQRELGVTKEHSPAFEEVWQKYRQRVCLDCDVDTLLPEFAKATGLSFPESYSLLQDFLQRFEQNQSIHPVVQLAKAKYKVGLLTNMYPRMLAGIKQIQLIPEMTWDAEVDSSIVNAQKPDPHIFEIAEKLAKVQPEEIFFIDNTLENVAAAASRGWQTFHYNPLTPGESSQQLHQALELT